MCKIRNQDYKKSGADLPCWFQSLFWGPKKSGGGGPCHTYHKLM